MPVDGAGKLLGCRVIVIAAVALACALAGPSLAAAEQFTVNTTADDTDAVVGNEFCETGAGQCTLRAAIEEANAAPNEDEIRFEEGVFAGDADSVIEPEPALPAIVSAVALVGGSCETAAGVPGPCAEIAGDSAAPGLKVDGAEGALVESLAITGGEVGIELLAAEKFFVKSNWLGTSLDGSAAGNETAIHIGPGSDDSRVGGEGEGAGNLIANSSAVGLGIYGASRVRVLGNRFGIAPTGDEAAVNESNIVVSSTADSVALENTIGTRLSPQAASTPACDGGCNLISGSAGNGVDLDTGVLAPPVATTIAGNLIGFDASGTGAIANGAAGIYVGGAPRTTVGGPKPTDANRFAGGTAAVEAGPGAPGLTIRGNLIGTRAGAVPPAIGGILVDSTSLRFPAEEAAVLGNEIGLESGTGILQRGFGATISGNAVEGGETGIRLQDEATESVVSANAISRTDGPGIFVGTSLNRIAGNTVTDAGAAGIRLFGAAPFGIGANVIGGDTPADENTIDGSAGSAIEIESTETSRNEIARNRGSGNGGSFIDLIPLGLASGDPNGGIQPPPVATISADGVAGFAEPGATVRVFRKSSTSPGEIASFLGSATADESGNWSLAFPGTLAPGTPISADQTLAGGSSELELTTVPSAEQGGQQQLSAAGFADRRPPRTRVLKQSRHVNSGGVARFAFTSNEVGSTFQCSLDRAPFKPCKSPKKYRLSRAGRHLFRVRAVDPAGNVDRTPVRRRFEVDG